MTEQPENEWAMLLRRKRLGVAIVLASIFGVFFVGLHYGLFGNEIDFTEVPANYLFFGFILLGMFGTLYMFFRAPVALKGTLLIASIYFLIFMLGKLSRGEL